MDCMSFKFTSKGLSKQSTGVLYQIHDNFMSVNKCESFRLAVTVCVLQVMPLAVNLTCFI